jgi:hypothetical protein
MLTMGNGGASGAQEDGSELDHCLQQMDCPSGLEHAQPGCDQHPTALCSDAHGRSSRVSFSAAQAATASKPAARQPSGASPDEADAPVALGVPPPVCGRASSSCVLSWQEDAGHDLATADARNTTDHAEVAREVCYETQTRQDDVPRAAAAPPANGVLIDCGSGTQRCVQLTKQPSMPKASSDAACATGPEPGMPAADGAGIWAAIAIATVESNTGVRTNAGRGTAEERKRGGLAQRSYVHRALLPQRHTDQFLMHDAQAAAEVHIARDLMAGWTPNARNKRVMAAARQALRAPKSMQQLVADAAAGRATLADPRKQLPTFLDRPLAHMVPFSIDESKWDVSPHVRHPSERADCAVSFGSTPTLTLQHRFTCTD